VEGFPKMTPFIYMVVTNLWSSNAYDLHCPINTFQCPKLGGDIEKIMISRFSMPNMVKICGNSARGPVCK
jgi:hypothetical protein